MLTTFTIQQTKIFAVIFICILMLSPLAYSAASLNPAQAQSLFGAATTSSQGQINDLSLTATLTPSALGSNHFKLDIWRQTDQGYEWVAGAPKAGCLDCSGPSRKLNPTRIWFADNALHVEYQGGGAGFGFWAWRSSWGWDAALRSLRPLATQRIGADKDGNARHALINFIDGSRSERLKTDSGIKVSKCSAYISKTPGFSDLSLGSLFDGSLEPECLAGTILGDPLANSPPPIAGGLENIMRPSKTAPIAAPVINPAVSNNVK